MQRSADPAGFFDRRVLIRERRVILCRGTAKKTKPGLLQRWSLLPWLSLALYSNIIKSGRKETWSRRRTSLMSERRRQGMRAFVRHVTLRMQSTIRLVIVPAAVSVIVTVNRDCLRFLLAERICLSRFITIADARAVSHVTFNFLVRVVDRNARF